MKTSNNPGPLSALRALARYATHAGYTWAMVADDGELICTPCVRGNYRQVFRATRDHETTGWQCVAITHSGEMESSEWCSNCGEPIHIQEQDQCA